jgi:ribosomal protein L16 Arg81 hydroxylase
MARAEFDLSRTISPVAVRKFFDAYWEKQPLILAREEPDYYADLLSLRDVDHVITATDLRYPAVRLVKNGAPIPLQRYTRDLNWGDSVFQGIANVDNLLHEYEQGATIVLQGLHRSWRPLSLFCRNLEKLFNHPVQTNIYLTPKNAQGFAPHYDTHDVLVLQVAGTKHWRVYGAPVALPLRSQPYQSAQHQPGEALHEFDLKAGDLIYLPRGFVHEGLTSESESLHITVGVITYTWMDVMNEALAVCRQDEHFRRSLPIGFAERADGMGALKTEFGALLDAFSANVDVEAVLNRIAERFVMSRLPLLDGHLTELDQADRMTVATSVQHRMGVIYRIEATDDTITLLYQGKRIKLPRYVEPELRFVVETDRFKVGDIAGDLDAAGKVVLARRLVKEGFLTLVGDA